MCKKSNATISELSNAANDGNAHAQLIFGWSYAAKSNENKNYEEAIKWLTRAANSGLQEAQFRLAIVYLMKRDIVGIGILNQLDYNGYSPATYELGNCFYTGLCVDRDELLGVKFWEKSQKMGHLLARMKFLKYKIKKTSLLKSFLLRSKLFYTFLKSIFIIAFRENNISVLGSLR